MDILKKIIFFLPAMLYGAITEIRNTLFNMSILPSTGYDIPVINVGNLSTGGTGKTPHVEMIAGLIKSRYKVAVISRGYRRKTTRFREVQTDSRVHDVGDEPLLLKKKHPEIVVAVDKDRKGGIRKVREQHPGIQVILLDDAFQHRWISPGLNILLTPYHRPYTEDDLLPLGTLREGKNNAKRADIIIMTKTPKDLSPIDMRIAVYNLAPLTHQSVFFTYIAYKHLKKVFPAAEGDAPREIPSTGTTVLLVTGIADPLPLKSHLEERGCEVISLAYKDHHILKPRDINRIITTYESYKGHNTIIITTEKDAVRLHSTPRAEELKPLPLYYVEISTGFHESDPTLEKEVLDHVKKDRGSYRIDPREGQKQSVGSNEPDKGMEGYEI